MKQQLKRIYALIMLLSVLSAVWIAVSRWSVERSNQTVGIVVDYYATRDLSNEVAWSVPETLLALKQAGVWGVGLEELTVSRAAREGLLMLFDGCEAGPALQAMGLGTLPVRESSAYVVWWPSTTPQWLAHSLRLHLGPWVQERANARGLVVWEIPAGVAEDGHANRPVYAAGVGNVGLGMAEHAVRAIRQAGLQVIPRFRHDPTLTEYQVRWRLGQIASPIYDTVPVVFSGARVPGYPDLLLHWATGLRDREASFGLIEFGSQPGDAQIARALGLSGLRLHAITPMELRKLDPQSAVERWRRAVRERDVRLLYVRPLPVQNPHLGIDTEGLLPVGELLMAKNLEYLRSIAQGIEKDGFAVGAPVPFESISYPWALLLLVAAGVALGSWLLLTRLVRLPERSGPWSVLLAVVIFGVGTALGYGMLLRKLMALVAAIVFPTWGVWAARDVANSDRGVLKGYWLASAISLLGALHVVAMLADVSFMLKIDQFTGVKLAHLAPPALVFLGVVLAPLPLAWERGPEGWGRVRRLFDAQVAVKYLVLAAVVGLLGLVYVMRTGNDALPVFAIEQRIRRLLEVLLVVRPRTKELLFGHPLLVVALSQRVSGRKRLGDWLLLGAVVGQLSMVNTFSHIHTALTVSVWRTLLGLLLGLFLGWFVARPLAEWVISRVERRMPERSEASA